MLSHDGTLSDDRRLSRLFEVLSILGHNNNTAALHFLLKAADELFIGFFRLFLEVNHGDNGELTGRDVRYQGFLRAWHGSE